MKIVDAGFKMDLHIHSIYSRGKDRTKVAYNTIEHIDVLANKLMENNVQLCAVTDHDEFGYDIYKALKKYEKDDNYSIIKVFPGIEFSVAFKGDLQNTVVHVIAIFDDSNDKKVEKISSFLNDENGKVAYDQDMAFSEEKFLHILREINLDTILIAHQKASLTSSSTKKCDANTVGENRFNEFLATNYFEAFEFKNKKNEVFNKSFIAANGIKDELRFITGSDCHDWRFYPKETEKDISEFNYTYVKCLPTFRGLVMAITDYRRIKTVNSFFNPAEQYLKSIDLTINGTDIMVPLSKGINVIIGDNSVGKSLLLHQLTGYIKKQSGLLKPKIIPSYKTYLKENKIVVHSEIPLSDIFMFDMQGEVREKFEQEKIKSDDFLRGYYPPPINAAPYIEKVQREVNKVYKFLVEKFTLDNLELSLPRFQIVDTESEQVESLTFVGKISRDNKRVEGIGNISSEIQATIEKLKSISESLYLENDDKEEIREISVILTSLVEKYNLKKRGAIKENTKIGLYQAEISNFKQKYQSSVSDSQKRLSAYNETLGQSVDSICDLVLRRKNNLKPQFALSKEKIEIQTNRVYEYEFNSRLGIIEIDNVYIETLFRNVLKKEVIKSIFDMKQEELADALPYFDGPSSIAIEELKKRVQEKIKEDFSEKYTITQHGMDRTKELSAGFNAKIYFDILSYETTHNGIYIIDQPEDNISQKSIREYLLNRFKVMGENRQVIIVTHNPQFIVNLDVDNVIYLGKNDDGIIVHSGALEYRDSTYSILNIISTQIEGGLDTLKRRWKRYEKNADISDI